MNHLNKISYFLLFFMISSFSYGQMKEYNYKRELIGISDQWNKIILPNELFGKTNQDLTDFRIFGLTQNNDTIEAPYLLRVASEKVFSKDVSFNTLNTSYNNKGYYFTFEIPTIESINQIKLSFKQENFDWRIKLEGSQDQNEWFTVTENYRILSIRNNETDFQFTKLTFPSSQYRFFRVFFNSQEKPELRVASITQNEVTDGIFRKYRIKKFQTKENKVTKQSEIDVALDLPVSVSHIKLFVSNTFDYYRPVTIKFLTDSTKTEQGWKYNYSTLASGTVNSIENNEFQVRSTIAQKLKIYIDNQDNQPLKINTIEVKGYEHELIARFTEQATYFLTYGNASVPKPNYDIVRFTDNIPETINELKLGNELPIEKEEIVVKAPLFKNKIWLWVIMIVIIVLLGWFSIKMMRKK